jgi:hypothetical protein
MAARVMTAALIEADDQRSITSQRGQAQIDS